jgi:hypothetical protein
MQLTVQHRAKPADWLAASAGLRLGSSRLGRETRIFCLLGWRCQAFERLSTRKNLALTAKMHAFGRQVADGLVQPQQIDVEIAAAVGRYAGWVLVCGKVANASGLVEDEIPDCARGCAE